MGVYLSQCRFSFWVVNCPWRNFFPPLTLGEALAALQHCRKFPWSWSPLTTSPLSLTFESCGSINQVGKGANPSFQEPFGPQFRYSSSMTPVPDPCVFIALCEMFSLLRTGQEVTWAPLNLRAVPGSCLYFKG